jgi:hypothetical protein
VTLPEALFGYLSGVAGVTSLIGSGTACRLYQLFTEQDPTYPCVVIEQVDDERPHSFRGNPTIAQKQVTFTCYSQTSPTKAHELADAIYTALMGNEASITGLPVKGILYEARTEGYEDAVETGGAKLFWADEDFRIFHN